MLGADERHSKGEISDEEYNDFIKKCQNVMDALPKNDELDSRSNSHCNSCQNREN